MKRYQTIVVATALDERDETTLRHASVFARAAESKAIYVAHVAPSFDLAPDAALEQPDLVVPVDEDIEEQLKQLIAKDPHRFPDSAQVRCCVRQGAMTSELVRMAVQKSADLLCLGRRPEAKYDPLSEAALRVLRKTPCSVFIVPAGAAPRYEHIVVPVDFSDHAREALELAASIAQLVPTAKITALHVYSVPTGYHKTGRSYDDFARSMKKLAEWQWDKFSPTVDFRRMPWTIRFELSENVAGTIVSVADELKADLVVMGSHGRGRSAGVLLGHIADSVCAHTSRPILCVKRKGEVVNLLHGLMQLFELE